MSFFLIELGKNVFSLKAYELNCFYCDKIDITFTVKEGKFKTSFGIFFFFFFFNARKVTKIFHDRGLEKYIIKHLLPASLFGC